MASFTYDQQKNIIGRTRSCIGDLGNKIVMGRESQKDVSEDECRLNYVFQVIDSLCRFIPVGEVVDGVTRKLADNNITQDQANKYLEYLMSFCPC